MIHIPKNYLLLLWMNEEQKKKKQARSEFGLMIVDLSNIVSFVNFVYWLIEKMPNDIFDDDNRQLRRLYVAKFIDKIFFVWLFVLFLLIFVYTPPSPLEIGCYLKWRHLQKKHTHIHRLSIAPIHFFWLNQNKNSAFCNTITN